MDHSEADLFIGIDTGSEQIGRIPWADASIRGVFGEIALVEGWTVQAHANARQGMFVAVDACQGLPPAFGGTVNIPWVDRHLPTSRLSVLPVPQHSVDAGGEYEASATGPSRRLEAVVPPDDIQRQQALVEVRFRAGVSGQMQNGVDPFTGGGESLQIGDIELDVLFVQVQILHRSHIGQSQPITVTPMLS